MSADKRKLLIDFIQSLGPEDVAKAAEAIHKSELGEAFAGAMEPAVTYSKKPQWAERARDWNAGTGQKKSPMLWVKMHFGNKDVDNWDSMGLTRTELSHIDPRLCNTYDKWIKRHPEDNLGLLKEFRSKEADPLASLNRHRQASLRSYHRKSAQQKGNNPA